MAQNIIGQVCSARLQCSPRKQGPGSPFTNGKHCRGMLPPCPLVQRHSSIQVAVFTIPIFNHHSGHAQQGIQGFDTHSTWYLYWTFTETCQRGPLLLCTLRDSCPHDTELTGLITCCPHIWSHDLIYGHFLSRVVNLMINSSCMGLLVYFHWISGCSQIGCSTDKCIMTEESSCCQITIAQRKGFPQPSWMRGWGEFIYIVLRRRSIVCSIPSF